MPPVIMMLAERASLASLDGVSTSKPGAPRIGHAHKQSLALLWWLA